MIVERRELNATQRSLFVVEIHLTTNVQTVRFEAHHRNLVILERRLKVSAQQNLNSFDQIDNEAQKIIISLSIRHRCRAKAVICSLFLFLLINIRSSEKKKIRSTFHPPINFVGRSVKHDSSEVFIDSLRRKTSLDSRENTTATTKHSHFIEQRHLLIAGNRQA